MNVTQTHKDFITKQLTLLADYDSKRPYGHVYRFHKHSGRVAQSMQELALHMGQSEKMAEALYWATLPHDIGKTALPLSIWDLKDKPTEDQRAERRMHTVLGVDIVCQTFGTEYKKDPFLNVMTDIMENHHECIDGTGFTGKTEKDLSLEVRMACICDAFDGWSVIRPHFGDRDVSPPAVIHRMKTEKAGQFDERLLNLFEETILKRL